MLHATYIPILEQQLVGLCSHERNLAIQQIRDIVGSIVLLAAPLTTSAIAALLSISKVVVDDRLDFLHSVLSIPATHTSPVKLLHLSFRDFFFDPTHKDRNPCWVDDQQVHQKLATHCVRLLNDGLSRDICELDWPGKPNVEVSLETIRAFFSAEVQYACRFWVYHLQKAGQSINDDDIVHQFLLHKFLYWIEACSLLDMVSECISNIKSLQSLLMPETAPNLRLFLRDALRFLLACAPAIKSAPLQTYSSAIFFAPKTSVIRNVFWDYRPSWISLLLTANEEWSHCEQTLDGHDDGVTSVVFSHDSKLLISGSRDRTVRVWLAQSGELLRTLRGHKSAVKSVAVSHDSEFIVSASQDKTVRIWSTSTGELRSVIPHCGPVSIATVSHDSKQIATASTDTAVRVWAVHTGELQRMVKCHDEAINSISFSHDSALIASASDDKTVRVLSTHTGEVQLTLGGHDSIVTSVAFSDDSIYIASGSYDYTARIWSANTGTLMWKLKGHHGPVTSVAFSPGSHLVASASVDQSVRIWSAMTGELQQTFGDHRSWVSSISISGDLNRVASASMDRKIRIWQTDLVGLHQSPQVSHLQTTWPFASISLSLRPRKEAVHNCMPDITESSHKSLHVCFLKDRELHKPRNMRTLVDLSAVAAKHCPLSETGPNPFENNANGACGPGISADLSWVTWGGRNLLWLPDEFRPWCSAVVGSCIIIGCDSGKVFKVEISK
ncbi:Vegetative incompatibility protein HET-E-1 [Colletotrichum siamense]|uniref:Vegetative incompatibility protein HET-E-1 n=1 Tax=Colletotrichum siamense TaxID=690259 RepID=A0A9P5EY10_COLSI|nr:Vegetative incompatibility protein HET-E-1 [Colletotrichum siamense]KAF4862065.1 Vegetative incompatibility protein HET-E-1 [Colletotrichum siamense]